MGIERIICFLNCLQREMDLELLSSHRSGSAVAAPLPMAQSYNPQTITHVTSPTSFFLSDVRGNQLEMIHARARPANNVRRPRNRHSWRRHHTLPHSPFPGLLLHFLYVTQFYITHIFIILNVEKFFFLAYSNFFF